MSSSLLQSRILLTGGTGHTGRRLAARLLEKGYGLRCLIHTPANKSRLPDNDKIEFVFGSASDPNDLARALEGIDTVLHIAHIRYAPAVVSALEKVFTPQHPARLIAMSSTRLLSRFPSETREAVRIGEAAIQNSSPAVEWTILRPSMIFGGPDDNNLERLAGYLRRTRFFPIFGSGQNRVQPVFVWDLVESIVSCIEKPVSIGKIYTIAGADAMPFTEMVRAVARASKANPPIFLRLPLRASLAATHLLKRLWTASPINPEMIERFGEERTFDITPAREDFGFAPISFSEALRKKFSGKA